MNVLGVVVLLVVHKCGHGMDLVTMLLTRRAQKILAVDTREYHSQYPHRWASHRYAMVQVKIPLIFAAHAHSDSVAEMAVAVVVVAFAMVPAAEHVALAMIPAVVASSQTPPAQMSIEVMPSQTPSAACTDRVHHAVGPHDSHT